MYEWTGEKVNAEIGLVDVGLMGGGVDLGVREGKWSSDKALET